MSDIVERLRHLADAFEAGHAQHNVVLHIRAGADEITRLRAENERLKTSGIAEVAAHNPSVMDWINHWEGRTLKAEAENERLRAALKPFACMCSVKGEGIGGLCFKGSCLYWNARAALEGKDD